MSARPQTVTSGFVAVLLMILLGISLFALFRIQVPSSNHDVLLVVIGVLTACVQTIVNYFFGSSSNSTQQQETIATQASTAATLAGNTQTTVPNAGITATDGPVAVKTTTTITPTGQTT